MLPAQEAARLYHSNYVRNSRAIGVLWAIFTICFAIVNVVCFIQPYWIGDGVDTPQAGYFGLFHYCVGGGGPGRELTCRGSFADLATLPSAAFQAASFFIGLSMMLTVACIACFALFFFCNTATVYKICAWMQLTSDLVIQLTLSHLIQPEAWNFSDERCLSCMSLQISCSERFCSRKRKKKPISTLDREDSFGKSSQLFGCNQLGSP
uniref:LHFPL tetraspan subfamily member 3 n=1 Tax=Ornithorhynchus anatinus TaxID=9258 RepID=A0A6I8PIH8_ORNAN